MSLDWIQRKVVLGLRITVSDGHSLIMRFNELILDRQGASICFVNAYTIYLSEHDKRFAERLDSADYLLNDGIGIEMASRAVGVRLKENLVGTDFIPRFLDSFSHDKARVFLIGGRRNTIQRAGKYVSNRFLNVNVVGKQDGYFPEEQLPVIFNELIGKKPNVILVGMGQPNQEHLVMKIRSIVPHALVFGVGGLFDYWANNLKRAPRLVRKLRLEWLHILCRQPYKFGRYSRCIPFLLKKILAIYVTNVYRYTKRYSYSIGAYILRRVCVGFSLLTVLRNRLSRKPRVCVFMYHHISDNKNVGFNVGTSRFEKQMKYLSRKGIVVHPGELENLRRRNAVWNGPKVLLTFDDGYSDFYENAYPVLNRLRLPCILFVNTANLDLGPESPYLMRSQLAMMDPEIVTVCSHGHTHAMLSRCKDGQAEHEISKSRQLIGELPFGNLKFFAYPYGTINAFDESLMCMLRNQGFQIAFTGMHGLVDWKTDFLKAPRIKVVGTDSILMFALAVSGGMNLWRIVDVYLNRLQRVPKA